MGSKEYASKRDYLTGKNGKETNVKESIIMVPWLPGIGTES